jgi:ribose 5-phosphate isomerase A
LAVTTDLDSPKLRVSRAGAALVESGMVVGLGSGSTAALMVSSLAERIASEALQIVGVATSEATAQLARKLGIPLRDLDEVVALDINLDGADEIDPQFHMIKGRGGALLREKLVAIASGHRVTMITGDKRVKRLGESAPVPVEVSSVGAKHTELRLRELGATTSRRTRSDGAPFFTDGGNAIIDCRFSQIDDPTALDRELQCIVGVLETGLFIDLCDTLIVATRDAVEKIRARPTI